MKRLVFDELLMLSQSERTARKVAFHQTATVIRGPNDTGKSSLIKSIYLTLGAVPPKIHDHWKAIRVRSVLSFSINEKKYRILKSDKRYTLFDADNQKIRHFDSVTNELGPFFADLFGFRLMLSTQKEEAKQATPAFLFLPFYCDQDRSWLENWDSFDHLRQFRSPRTDAANYHTGIRPNEFYLAKLRLREAETELESLQEERRTVEQVIRRIDVLLEHVSFDLDLDAYQAEIERLLRNCNRLRQAEEQLKKEIVQLHNAKMTVESQLTVAVATAGELGKDFRFACEQLNDTVECPTCGASYANSFAERFHIAADEDRCRELITDLKAELQNLDQKLLRTHERTGDVKEQVRAIREVLTVKRGEIQLQDIIKSEGKKEVREVLQRDINNLNSHIGKADQKVDHARADMARHDDKALKQQIKKKYASRMRSFLSQLRVFNLPESQYRRIDARINESGSDLPRALLAYYFAILQTIAERSSSTFCPIVIDSPKQQDQDEENWTRILTFIRDNLPESSQLILSVVDDQNIDFGGTVIDLDDKYHVLQTAQYDEVMSDMRPLLDASLMD